MPTLDPRLKTYWLSAITEAQPIWSIVRHNPAMAVSYYVTPLLGLLVLDLEAPPRRDGRGNRGAGFSGRGDRRQHLAGTRLDVRHPLATIPLAAWVGEWRARVAAGGDAAATLKMALAWLVSLNVVWSASANAIAGAVGAPLSPGGAEASAGTCNHARRFLRRWPALPATTVLADLQSRLADPRLYRTIACWPGPITATSPATFWRCRPSWAARPRPRRSSSRTASGWSCCAAAMTKPTTLSGWAPAGFIAALLHGNVPAWLEKLPGAAGEPLEIYRVRKPS